MNFSFSESLSGKQQRCRYHWVPLITQQLRLRHVYQIVSYNLTSDHPGKFYYTLHLTAMCSPFYTSEKLDNANPKWAELCIDNLPNLSTTCFVLRIWQERLNEMDIILTTIGVNLSGLVYLGNKLPIIQPVVFNPNSVIFNIRGGYFSSHLMIRTDLPKPPPFIDYLNVISSEGSTSVFRNVTVKIPVSTIKTSYNVENLQRIQSLQISIRNKTMDVEILRDKINRLCNITEGGTSEVKPTTSSTDSSVRYAPQLLTMNTLNKMLEQEKRSPGSRQARLKLAKEIELVKFRTKLLSQEKDRKTCFLRKLKEKHANILENKEEQNTKLMEDYHALGKKKEKLKEWRLALSQHKQFLSHCCHQLYHRRRQLLQQLLFVYPINQVGEHKFIINGIYLPNSDLLTECSDGGLAVALGYATHVLIMCAAFLQIPLRYSMVHYGSRSQIIDHISPALPDKERSFALYKTSKDRIQFNYAVYLLNRNIAQLRFLCGLHTPDLKATLPNLLGLLQGKGYKTALEHIEKTKAQQDSKSDVLSEGETSVKSDDQTKVFSSSMSSEKLLDLRKFGSSSSIHDPILDSLKGECHTENAGTSRSVIKKTVKPAKNSECGPGLSEILAIPEAYLNREISTLRFKQYVRSERFDLPVEHAGSSASPRGETSKKSIKPCDIKTNNPFEGYYPCTESVEEGTDILNDTLNGSLILDEPDFRIPRTEVIDTRQKRSIDAYTEHSESSYRLFTGSDPAVNLSAKYEAQLPSSLDDKHEEVMQKWLDSGPAHTCPDENLYPEEILGRTEHVGTQPLMARADALRNSSKSFNLLRPKF